MDLTQIAMIVFFRQTLLAIGIDCAAKHSPWLSVESIHCQSPFSLTLVPMLGLCNHFTMYERLTESMKSSVARYNLGSGHFHYIQSIELEHSEFATVIRIVATRDHSLDESNKLGSRDSVFGD